MLTIYNNIKRILKNRLLKSFAIVTKDINTNQSFVTIGALKSCVRYKAVYLGKDANVITTLIIRFNILKFLKRFHDTTGLVIINDPSLAALNRNLFLMQPEFIVLEIPLPDTIDEYLKSITKDAKNNLKKLEKIGFTCTISNDKNWVDIFYNDYYVPTMIDRHSEDAALVPKSEMLAIVNNTGAEFVKLFLDGKCVAAAVTILENDNYCCIKIGYLKGELNLLQKGIVTAIYKFRIQRAYELGCKTIILGGTPPFLENGVFTYKAKWQARFCPEKYYTENYLLLNPQNKYCYEFLRNNSLVVFGLQNRLIVLSSKNPNETKISGNILNDINCWYILRESRVENYSSGMEDLPEHLRYWYERYYDIN